ncbi:MAG: hypothetical protein ACI9GW_002336, partial [Halieaceae bacterium]
MGILAANWPVSAIGSSAMPIKASLVEQGQNSLTLQWSDGSQTTYDYLWL